MCDGSLDDEVDTLRPEDFSLPVAVQKLSAHDVFSLGK